MPSVNLYSAEGFDDSSLTDELAPTDGYFEPSRMPFNTTVPDPSIEMKTEPKTLIPSPDTRRQYCSGNSSITSLQEIFPGARAPPGSDDASIQSTGNVPSPRTYTPIPLDPIHNEEGIFPEHMPLMNGPPPAYSPSPISFNAPRSSPLNPSSDRIYNTLPEHYLEQGFFTNRVPDSMGGEAEEPNERTPLSKITATSSRRRRIRNSICLAVPLAVVLTFLLLVFYRRVSVNPISNMPGFPNRPVDTKDPYCVAAKHQSEQATYEFPVGSDISVIQTTHADDGEFNGFARVKTAGEIRLRKLPKDSKHGTRAFFTIDVHVSDPELEVVKTWDEGARVLKVSTPMYANLDSRGPHCVSLEITAWIPESVSFQNLLVEAVTLTLRVLPDAKMSVSGRSKFSTVSGKVIFPSIDQIDGDNPSFSSRRIIVETVSNAITGGLALLDLLAISSQSGSVTVDVAPQKLLKSAPLPADLEVQTASGIIKVNLPVDLNYTPPPRDYITRIHSSSGSIDGSYYLGSLSNFRSMSGSIKITALPVLPDNGERKQNIFETHTIAGSTNVEVLDPIFFIGDPSPIQADPSGNRPLRLKPILNQVFDDTDLPAEAEDPNLLGDDSDPYLLTPPSPAPSQLASKTPLRSLDAKHSSSSASVLVSYPSNWEGSIHAKTVSGQITTKGELRLVRSRDSPGFKEILARKGVEGDEGAFVDMTDIAGSLAFEVRDVGTVVRRR